MAWYEKGQSARGTGLPVRLEAGLVGAAIATALALGFANLGGPSFWHDELVHVYLAKGIASTGLPKLPSGHFIGNSVLYNAILAGVVAVAGHGETAMRTPSVLFAALNVLLAYLLTRRVLGRAPALIAAFLLAWSPWSVAWSREARFYVFQQTVYLLAMGATWRVMVSETRGQIARWAAVLLALFVAGLFVCFHSVVFAGTVAAFAFFLGCFNKSQRRRAWTVCAAAVAAGLITSVSYYIFFAPETAETVFKLGGLGGQLADTQVDHVRSDRYFYFSWLGRNLSTGYLGMLALGSLLLLIRERWRGLFMALAFWVPALVLTFLVGYRRPRFLFFCFPFYCIAVAYAAVQLAAFAGKPRPSWVWRITAILIVLLGARLAWSTVKLTRASLDAASGAHVTLARRHPQWRDPCRYVRERLDADTVVITTTFLPVHHYVGRVDNWYPSRSVWWEPVESGMEGLLGLPELQAYVREHPNGYFLSEYRRFEFTLRFEEEIEWVQEHMIRIDEGSSADVTLYAWGVPARQAIQADSPGGEYPR